MQNKRYNSDGEELFFDDETKTWLPKHAIVTEEEKQKYYSRFEHPKINFLKLVIIAFVYLIILTGLITIQVIYSVQRWIIVIDSLVFLILTVIVFAKKLIILAIRLYQRFAPMRTREKCVFTPTCSTYTIQAVQKYGAIKGLILGYKRIKRCHGEYRDDPLK